jgi:acyl-CoA dehydrogenase
VPLEGGRRVVYVEVGTMSDPFLEERHNSLALKVRAFGDKELRPRANDEANPFGAAVELGPLLAAHGLLAPAVLPPFGTMDARSLVTVREELAYFSGLADAVFGTQALGALPIALAGSEAQKGRWLPAVVRGDTLAALAVTEPEAGSDLSSVRTRAERDGLVWRLEGVKTLVSHGSIAGLYTVLARSAETEGARGLSMFLVDAEAPGVVTKRLEAMAAHALGEVRFDGTPAVLLGDEGTGYQTTLAALELTRPGVGAAACGLAARAMDESVRWAMARRQFARPLAHQQNTRFVLAEMRTELEAARLLVRRAAWLRDVERASIPREGAEAKLFATETAQRIVDRAVQIHGGQGILKGATVERLYREVRALRIDGGTSEVQKLVIAREILKDAR